MGFEPTQKLEVPAHEREIPESEFEISYALGSGPGGQKRNKTETKARLRWNLGKSRTFSLEEKIKIRQALASQFTKEGELVLENDETRSQKQNTAAVIRRARELVSEALIPDKERIATKPTAGSNERRIASKKKEALKKADRRRGDE